MKSFHIYIIFQYIYDVRSVARGGSSSPIGLKSLQNSTFLVLLRPSFAPKIKTASAMGFGSRSSEGLAVIWTRIVEFFGSGAHPVGEDLFFLGSLNFD